MTKEERLNKLEDEILALQKQIDKKMARLYALDEERGQGLVEYINDREGV